jgi:phytoene desaturase
MRPQKVLIIGSGIGGLATANLLAKAGYSVDVYEKESSPGGRAGTMTKDGFRFDTGPSWYLMPDVFEHYFDLLDQPLKSWLSLKRLTPAYKVFFEGNSSVTITGMLEEDAKTFEAIEKGTGEALKAYVHQADIIYKLAMKHFLYSNFTSLRDFTKKDVLLHAPRMVSMMLKPIDGYVRQFVSDIRLKQILEYPMVFLGTSPFTAPAMYSLMSALDFKEGVFYPKGGIYTIIDSLVKIGNQLGVTYHYNKEVTSITTRGKIATGIIANNRMVPADIIVSNADLHHTETRLLKPSEQSYPESYWQKKEASPSALLIYLGIKGKVPEFEHHTLLFVKDWKKNFEAIYSNKSIPDMASIYISKTSQSDATVAPRDHENIFVLVPLPAGISLNKKSQTNLAKKYLEQIKIMTGVDLDKRSTTQTLFGPVLNARTIASTQTKCLFQDPQRQ